MAVAATIVLAASSAAPIAFAAQQFPFNSAASPSSYRSPGSFPSSSFSSSSFSLSHAVHLGTHRHPGLNVHYDYRKSGRSQAALPMTADGDVEDGEMGTYSVSAPTVYDTTDLHVRSVRQKIWRPSHPAGSDVYEAARRTGLHPSNTQLASLARQLTWDEVETEVPDVSDVETLSTLAKMSSNAYLSPKSPLEWYDLSNNTIGGVRYNLSTSFGWQEDGIRGHIFSSSPNNENIIIAVKGTSGASGGIGSPTGRNDKLNDNLLFSCCCARVDWSWSPVCDCFAGVANRCNNTCLEQSLIDKSVYYPTATDMFNNITAMYPTSNIWLTGHSLGGSLASLLAITFGIPCVTFEAPAELLAAKRLHLPLPPGSNWEDKRPEFGVTHVYTNSDPIPQGVCTGALSPCALVGFALESRCHTGQSIIYDAVGKLGWSVDIRTHRIGVLIDRLLIPDWDKDAGKKSIIGSSNSALGSSAYAAKTSHSNKQKWRTWKWPWSGKRPKEPSTPGEGDGDDRPDEPSPTRSPDTPAPTHTSRVPKPEIDTNCTDCFKWEFFDDDGSNTSSVRSSLKQYRRTVSLIV